MNTTARPDAVSIDQLFAEAALRYPDTDLVESIRTGCQALGMASDADLDPARREIARRHGFEVVLWLTSLIDSARARQGIRPAIGATVTMPLH